MPPKRMFLQQQSRGYNSRGFSSEIDDANEQRDTIGPFQSLTPEEQQQHLTQRRSSLPILDIKLRYALSYQTNNESNDLINGPEDVCECE